MNRQMARASDNASNDGLKPQRYREASRRHDYMRPLEFKKALRAVFVYSWAFGVPIVPKFWDTKLDVVNNPQIFCWPIALSSMDRHAPWENCDSFRQWLEWKKGLEASSIWSENICFWHAVRNTSLSSDITSSTFHLLCCAM